MMTVRFLYRFNCVVTAILVGGLIGCRFNERYSGNNNGKKFIYLDQERSSDHICYINKQLIPRSNEEIK